MAVQSSLNSGHEINPPAQWRWLPLRDSRSAANTIPVDHLISAGEQRRWHFNSARLAVLRLMMNSNLIRGQKGIASALAPVTIPAMTLARCRVLTGNGAAGT